MMIPVELVWQHGTLKDDLVAAVLSLADQAFAADAVDPLSEVPRLALRHRDPTVSHVLVFVAAAVVAYAQVDAAAESAELVVAPVYRCHGYGRAVLEGLFETYPDLKVWAHGNLPAATALAHSAGARQTRELLLMHQTPANWLAHRPTLTALTSTHHTGIGPNHRFQTNRSGLADTAVGQVSLRHFIPGQDEPAWLSLNAAAFADHPEQGQIRRFDLDQRLAEDWFEAEGLILAVAPATPSQPLGYVWTKLTPTPSPSSDQEVAQGRSHNATKEGEIYAIGVNPTAQGHRLGTVLLAAGLDHLSARGATDLVLYVEASQVQAVHLYRKAGFEVAARDVQYARRR